MTTTPVRIRTFEEASARLAESLPNYERRLPQDRLATFVEQRFADGRHGLAEAGCGVGKSLGYLIPSVLSGERVVVSTATKALQDQIANKDLPFLAERLGVPFTHAILKGKSNYLCRSRLVDAGTDDPELAKRIYETIDAHAADEHFLAEQTDFEIEDGLWRYLTISTDDCPGKKLCPFGEECFSERAKAYAKEADVVVVNHALFLTDLSIRDATDGKISMLGDYRTVIFDEAHELEEYATTIWGKSIQLSQFEFLRNEVRRFGARSGEQSQADEISDLMLDAAKTLFNATHNETVRLSIDALVVLGDKIIDLSDQLGICYEFISDYDSKSDDEKAKKERLLRNIANKRNIVASLLAADPHTYVRYTEMVQGKNGKPDFKIIKIAPVDVSDELRRALFGDGEHQALLVSATLTVEGEFGWVAGRLGIDQFDSVNVGTPFDYQTQARLYVPVSMPSPSGSTRLEWESKSIEEMERLVLASNGRALLLFTGIKQMNAAFDALSARLPYACFKQGQAPNAELAADFMADVHSVLFATRSFFTGVDFQGEACSLVVIDKLVFDVPTDPIVSARCDLIDSRHGARQSFGLYSIPKMSLTLAQGFGRLIRHREDRGVVAILDSRLVTKGYGKKILRSLPDSPIIGSLGDVEQFFGEQ